MESTTGHRDRSPGRPGEPRRVYELQGVEKVYGSGEGAVAALAQIDLVIPAREVVAIVGASGSGKTTLLQLLGALDRPTAGTVVCNGRDLQSMGEGDLSRLRRDVIGFVFQQFNLIPTLAARQNVEVAAASTGLASDERRARATELLAAVGLGAREDHLPSQLSGGEQQRVAIARALMNRPTGAARRRADRQPRLGHRRGDPLPAAGGGRRERADGGAHHPRAGRRRGGPPGGHPARRPGAVRLTGRSRAGVTTPSDGEEHADAVDKALGLRRRG